MVQTSVMSMAEDVADQVRHHTACPDGETETETERPGTHSLGVHSSPFLLSVSLSDRVRVRVRVRECKQTE